MDTRNCESINISFVFQIYQVNERAEEFEESHQVLQMCTVPA